MLISEFNEKAEEIIEAYKGFNIFKNGSNKDKIIYSILIFFFIVASVILFLTNILCKNDWSWILGIVLFMLVTIKLYYFQQKIQKRETKVYIKQASKEENFLHYCEQKINEKGITRKDYSIYIEHFTNKLNHGQTFQANELILYLTTIFIPILITVITKNYEIETFILSMYGNSCLSRCYICI